MNDETIAQKITSMQRCVAQARKIVVAVIERNLDDLLAFAEKVRPILTAADR